VRLAHWQSRIHKIFAGIAVHGLNRLRENLGKSMEIIKIEEVIHA
jgi:hypothetical protein